MTRELEHINTPPVQPSEGATPAASAATPVGALLARHVLREGEVILLAIKPSFWFILLSCLKFLGVVALAVILAIHFNGQNRHNIWIYSEAGVFLAAGRLMFAVLQWMGRLYILTDMRVLRLAGIFSVDIFDCPLRKVGRLLVLRTVKERLFGLGTIEIVRADESNTTGYWQMVRRPAHVQAMIQAAINKARQY